MLIHRRFEAFRNRNYSLFQHLKNKVKIEIQKAKTKWVAKLKRAKSGVWRVVRELNSQRAASSGSLQCLISQYTDAFEAANAINKEFSSVFGSATIQSVSTVNLPSPKRWILSMSIEETRAIICKLDISKSGGSDGLSPFLLKSASDILAAPLTHLLCLSVETGEVPSLWKEANIVPIPKGKASSIKDLRPISLIPLVAKILEK